MSDNNSFKIGDKIVRFSRVWKIFKIEKKKDSNGEMKKTLHYKPFFAKNLKSKISFSIPVENIGDAFIRTPISKKELKNFLKSLSEKPDLSKPLNLMKTKEELELNDFSKKINILRILHWDQKEKAESFTKSKENILKLAINKLSEEVAFIHKFSLANAKQKIKKALV